MTRVIYISVLILFPRGLTELTSTDQSVFYRTLNEIVTFPNQDNKIVDKNIVSDVVDELNISFGCLPTSSPLKKDTQSCIFNERVKTQLSMT